MKRKFLAEVDKNAYFALHIISVIEASDASPENVIGVNVGQLYELAQSYLGLYENINKGRSTYVEPEYETVH